MQSEQLSIRCHKKNRGLLAVHTESADCLIPKLRKKREASSSIGNKQSISNQSDWAPNANKVVYILYTFGSVLMCWFAQAPLAAEQSCCRVCYVCLKIRCFRLLQMPFGPFEKHEAPERTGFGEIPCLSF